MLSSYFFRFASLTISTPELFSSLRERRARALGRSEALVTRMASLNDLVVGLPIAKFRDTAHLNHALSQAPSTRIRKFVKTQIFFYEYGLRPHVSSVFSGRIRKFLKTLSRVEIFLSDTNTYTCGRSYPQICEYAYVILLDPVFTASIKQTWRTARLCLLC